METRVTFKPRIKIDGQEYASVEDMPADVREAYERAMASLAAQKPKSSFEIRLKTKSKIVVNGQEYSSVEDMPPEVRQAYQRLMRRTKGVALNWIAGILLVAWLLLILIRHATSHP